MTYQKRVPLHSMGGVLWQHGNSWLDADVWPQPYSTAPVRSGCTEWTATYDNQTLSMGWDWVMTHDGLVAPYFCTPPRSNFLWLDDDGHTIPFKEQIHALQQIPLSIQWSDSVLSVAR